MNITRLKTKVNQSIKFILSDFGLIAYPSVSGVMVSEARRAAISFVAKYVPHRANRMQESGAAIRLELLSQVADRHVYDVRQRVEVLVPDMLGQLRAADYPLRVPQKVFEQGV